MVPVHLLDAYALFIMIVWCVVWLSFLVLGRHGEERSPHDLRLTQYSTLSFASITLFYWVTFSAVGNISKYFGRSSIETGFVSSNLVSVAGIGMVIIGAACMITARWQLRHLTITELVFARSEKTVRAGLYHYLRHPMYAGLLLILCGSFFLYPNVIALLPLASTAMLLGEKKAIEE